MECTHWIEWNTELGCTSIVLNGDCELISLQCLNGVYWVWMVNEVPILVMLEFYNLSSLEKFCRVD